MAITIPAGPQGLTPAWLTDVLRQNGVITTAAVHAATAEPVGQGAGILCHLYRVHLQYDRPEPAAPATLIAKLPTTEAQTRQMVAMFQFYEREVRFYADLAGDIDLRTARSYGQSFDPSTGDFFVLLEDVADRRIGDQLEGASLAEAQLVVTELARHHAKWWNHPRLASDLTWMPDAGSAVNKAGLMLYPMAWGPFMQNFGHTLPEKMKETGEKLGAQAGAILERFAGSDTTICHGDTRLDNLFFARTPEQPPLTVIDWQIAIRGTGTYDIGYFMSQSVGVDMRRAHERDLLALYHETLRAGGVGSYSDDQMLEDYRWTLLFCFAYPVMAGGLGDLANERGAALARTMAERSTTAIMDWDAGALI